MVGCLPEVRRRPDAQSADHQRQRSRGPPAPPQLEVSQPGEFPGVLWWTGGRDQGRYSARSRGNRRAGIALHGAYESDSAARHGFDVLWILG